MLTGVDYPVSSDQPYNLVQCDDCGHCKDFHTPTDDDPEALKKERAEFEGYLDQWLGEFSSSPALPEEEERTFYTVPAVFGNASLASCSGAPSCGTKLASYNGNIRRDLLLCCSHRHHLHVSLSQACGRILTVSTSARVPAAAPTEHTATRSVCSAQSLRRIIVLTPTSFTSVPMRGTRAEILWKFVRHCADMVCERHRLLQFVPFRHQQDYLS